MNSHVKHHIQFETDQFSIAGTHNNVEGMFYKITLIKGVLTHER